MAEIGPQTLAEVKAALECYVTEVEASKLSHNNTLFVPKTFPCAARGIKGARFAQEKPRRGQDTRGAINGQHKSPASASALRQVLDSYE